MSVNIQACRPLTEAAIQQCYANGFVIVPDLFSGVAVRNLKVAAQAAVGAGDSSGVKVFMADNLPEAFRCAVTDARIVSILQQLIGPAIEFLSIKPVYKSKSVRFGSPWHQDHAYWRGSNCNSNSNKWSVWIALDDATEANGCLKVIPGTHHKFIPHTGGEDEHGFANRIADAALAGLPVVTASAAAGTAIFFHDLLVHGSHDNVAGEDRWSFIPTYRDCAVADTSTVWQETIKL